MSDADRPAMLGQALDLSGTTETAGLAALVVAAAAVAGILLVWRRLRQVPAGRPPAEPARAHAPRPGTLREMRETLEVSASAAALLERFTEELAAAQFARGAEATVMERLDGAVARLRQCRAGGPAGAGEADALQSLAREIRAVRLDYASASHRLAPDAEPRPAGAEPASGESEYAAVIQAARRAVAAFGSESGFGSESSQSST